MGLRATLWLSMPERLARTIAAVAGGIVHETATLVLPRLVRRSRLYEATAKNLLRITVELVGGVEPPVTTTAEVEPIPAASRSARGPGTSSSSARSRRSASRRCGCSRRPPM